MPYVVEIQIIDDDLTARMSLMRTWLDHNGIQPISFRSSGGGAQPQVCRVIFKTEREAIAFAQKFGVKCAEHQAPMHDPLAQIIRDAHEGKRGLSSRITVAGEGRKGPG